MTCGKLRTMTLKRHFIILSPNGRFWSSAIKNWNHPIFGSGTNIRNAYAAGFGAISRSECPLVGFISSRDKGASGKLSLAVETGIRSFHTEPAALRRCTQLRCQSKRRYTIRQHASSLRRTAGRYAQQGGSYKLPPRMDEPAIAPTNASYEEGFDPRFWHPLVRTNPDTGRRAYI